MFSYLRDSGVEQKSFVSRSFRIRCKDKLRISAGKVLFVQRCQILFDRQFGFSANPVGIEPGVELHISAVGRFDHIGEGIETFYCLSLGSGIIA